MSLLTQVMIFKSQANNFDAIHAAPNGSREQCDMGPHFFLGAIMAYKKLQQTILQTILVLVKMPCILTGSFLFC